MYNVRSPLASLPPLAFRGGTDERKTRVAQEDEVLFCRTMHGVMKNIQKLCERSRSRTWGADGWKKVVVCVVSDGRAKINSRTLSVLAAMGVYQDGVAKNVVAGKPVTAHIYEYTTQGAFGFSFLSHPLRGVNACRNGRRVCQGVLALTLVHCSLCRPGP